MNSDATNPINHRQRRGGQCRRGCFRRKMTNHGTVPSLNCSPTIQSLSNVWQLFLEHVTCRNLVFSFRFSRGQQVYLHGASTMARIAFTFKVLHVLPTFRTCIAINAIFPRSCKSLLAQERPILSDNKTLLGLFLLNFSVRSSLIL